MVQFFCDHVTSFTTDFGIEMGIALAPNVLPALMAWIGGRPLEDCRLLVGAGTRLFRRCLRIAGWNHTMGGGGS